jgi:hypothetical protein
MIRIIKEQSICKCGHKEKDHNSWGTECYVFKHIKGSHYQCTCRKFEEKEKK